MYKNWAGHTLPGVPQMEPGDTWRVTFTDGEGDMLALYTDEEELVDLEDGTVYTVLPADWTYELVNIQFLIMEN